MKIVDFLLFLWQLPQNVIGWIIYHFYKMQNRASVKVINGIIVYDLVKFNGAVSLGDYILIDVAAYVDADRVVAHESGHQKQSKMLGWLYLLLVGIPSITRNIYARIVHKNAAWYYGYYPENWADKLGKVDRNFSKNT